MPKHVLDNRTSKEGTISHATAGESLGNGVHVELVRTVAGADPQLLLWDGSSATIGESVEYMGRIYAPLPIEPTILQRLRFPPGIARYGSIQRLFSEMRDAILRYGNVTDDGASLLTYFRIGSWFSDVLASAPSIVMSSAVAGEGVLLLRLLSCFCRRPLLLGEVSAAGLQSLPAGIRPTLLIQQSEVSASMQRVLCGSSYRCLAGLRNGRLLDVYGAKAIATRPGAILPDNFLSIALAPRRPGQASPFDDHVEEELFMRFQPMLLLYRLQNLERVAAATFDAPELVSPVREIARVWGQCVLDEELRRGIIRLLKPRDEEVRAERSVDHRAIVIEALLALCHDPQAEAAYVSEISQGMNTLLQMRGEMEELEPRRAGAIMKSLGISSERLDKGGRGIRLHEKVRQQIHRLALDFGVRSLDDGIGLCRHCATEKVDN